MPAHLWWDPPVHFEAHAGVGWVVGNLPPSSDRRLRNWCLTAAVIPDIDAVAYLFGPQAYGKYHHTFGHNVFLGVALAGLAAWHYRDRPRRNALFAAALVALCFFSHLLADAKLSAYEVYLFWPFSRQGFEFVPNLGLAAPINTYLVYASFAAVFLIALWKHVTPIDVFSPRLDRLVLTPLRSKLYECQACGRRCADRCESCDSPTCLRHSLISKKLQIRCSSCAAPG